MKAETAFTMDDLKSCSHSVHRESVGQILEDKSAILPTSVNDLPVKMYVKNVTYLGIYR